MHSQNLMLSQYARIEVKGAGVKAGWELFWLALCGDRQDIGKSE
jgi:hypothetical protein